MTSARGCVNLGVALVRETGCRLTALYVTFVDALRTTPGAANVLAFSIAVVVSYIGNVRWTFRAQDADTRRNAYSMFARFALSALLGLALNTVFVLIVSTMTWNYLWAVPFFVCVTPLLLFFANKLWVFRL